MPMYGTGYVFSKKFFTGWVSVGILWLFCSAFCVGLYPLWEGRTSMKHTFTELVKDLAGKGKPVMHGRTIEIDEKESDGEGTPVKGKGEKGPAAVVETGDQIKAE